MDNYVSISQSNLNNEFFQNDITSDEMLIDLFLEQKSKSTQKTYRHAINEYIYFINTYMNIFQLKQAGVRCIAEYKKGLINYIKKDGSPLKESTISQRLKFISSLYGYGETIGYFQFNPVRAITKPKPKPNNRHKFLTLEQLSLLLKAMRKLGEDSILGERNYLIGSMLIFTGLRISELCNIRWKDFALEQGIYITLQIKRKGGKWDTIKIRKELWFYIERYRKALSLSTDFDPTDETPLFYNYKGEPLTHWGIRKLIDQAAKMCFPKMKYKVTPHWFRHSAASLALSNGADLHKVMEQFGWTNLSTPNLYLHNIKQLEETATDYIPLKLL